MKTAENLTPRKVIFALGIIILPTLPQLSVYLNQIKDPKVVAHRDLKQNLAIGDKKFRAIELERVLVSGVSIFDKKHDSR